LLESGVSYLSQGRLDVAFELLSEALVIFSQVYGPMHQATAICFRYYMQAFAGFIAAWLLLILLFHSNMAMVLYQSGDPAEASIYQQKAVIINERVQGLDHHETAQSYVCATSASVMLCASF
jgi:protein TIF31